MKIVLLAGMIMLAHISWAQKYTIKGQAIDSTRSALPSATVLLLNPVDSSLINFAATNAQGVFELKNVAKGDHLVKITFVGYRSSITKVSAEGDNSLIDLGQLTLEVERKHLDEVIIKGEAAPVTIKKDTIEFNAASFKTQPNAMVEDLLKRLPGVQVESDGTITAQGQEVRRVTVDGKDFFGRDPKLATRNLPADAIDKVQLFDRQSDQAAFTGIDDGQREKTINLQLKEEKRNGAFGNMMAGVGTDDRFTGRLSLNRFSKGRQLSILGMANNTNEQGFSIGEYMNFTGGAQQMMGGRGQVRFEIGGENSIPLNTGTRANGILTNYAGGLNFNNEFSKKTEANGSYFYSHLDHAIRQTTERDNFLPDDRSFRFNQNARQINTNDNHRTNITLDHKIDSANILKLTTNASFSQTSADQKSNGETYTPEGILQNESERVSLSSGSTFSFNSNLLYRHRFNKRGRNMSSTLQTGASQSDRDGSLNARNTFYSGPVQEQLIQQLNFVTNKAFNYGASVSYTEPLGNRKYLEANYNFRENRNDVNQEVFDLNNGERNFNTQLSNSFDSRYMYNRAGLNFRMNRQAFNLTVGTNFQQTRLKGNLHLADTAINRVFENILPAIRFNYQFSSARNLRVDYETSVQEPSIQQLQPVINNNDPLNIYVGNPGLRPAYMQRLQFNFTTFDPATFLSFFMFADFTHVANAITNSQLVNEQLVRTTTPVNVRENTMGSINASLSFPINKLFSRVNLSANAREQRTINLLNETENSIRNQSIGGVARYTFRYKDFVDLNVSADLRQQLTRYEFDQPDQKFFNKVYTAENNLSFLKSYQFATNFSYLVYTSTTTDFRQTIPLLGLSVSRFLLKNKSGELKLSANNLLDQDLGVNQVANANYFEREVTNSLGRYFMVSFTYAINKHLNPMGNRRGMIQMMR